MNPTVNGDEVRVEQYGREVHVIFVAEDQRQADAMRIDILSRLRDKGGVKLTLKGWTVEEV